MPCMQSIEKIIVIALSIKAENSFKPKNKMINDQEANSEIKTIEISKNFFVTNK